MIDMYAERRDQEHTEHQLEQAVTALLEAGNVKVYSGWRGYGEKLVKRMLLSEIEFLTARVKEMRPEARKLFMTSILFLASSGKFRRRDSLLHHAIYLAVNIAPIVADLQDAGMDDSIEVADTAFHALDHLRWCRAKRMPDDFESRDHAVVQGHMFEWLLSTWIESRVNINSSERDYYRWLSENRTSVIEVLEPLKERKSARPAVIRELVENSSKPLTSGVL